MGTLVLLRPWRCALQAVDLACHLGGFTMHARVQPPPTTSEMARSSKDGSVRWRSNRAEPTGVTKITTDLMSMSFLIVVALMLGACREKSAMPAMAELAPWSMRREQVHRAIDTGPHDRALEAASALLAQATTSGDPTQLAEASGILVGLNEGDPAAQLPHARSRLSALERVTPLSGSAVWNARLELLLLLASTESGAEFEIELARLRAQSSDGGQLGSALFRVMLVLAARQDSSRAEAVGRDSVLALEADPSRKDTLVKTLELLAWACEKNGKTDDASLFARRAAELAAAE